MGTALILGILTPLIRQTISERRPSMTKSFVAGVITGAVAVWWLKDPITAQLNARTAAVRVKMARKLHEAASAIERGLEGTPPTVPALVTRSS